MTNRSLAWLHLSPLSVDASKQLAALFFQHDWQLSPADAQQRADSPLMEALLLAWAGFRLTLRTNPTGLALFLFALVLQPLIGPLLGRPWAQVELFGLAPDPTVVGTTPRPTRRNSWAPSDFSRARICSETDGCA